MYRPNVFVSIVTVSIVFHLTVRFASAPVTVVWRLIADAIALVP
jgi:hypothetical protein